MKTLLALLLSAMSVTAANITLSWDPSQGATSYRVYRAEGTSAFSSILSPAVTSVSIAVNTNVVTRYFVSAVNSVGESAPSSVVTNNPAAPVGTITLSAPILSSTNLTPGQTVTGVATFKNGTSTPFSLGAGLLSARRPGTSNDTGPYDNWTPDIGVQTVAAGSTLTIPGSWTVPLDAPPGQWRVYLSIRNAITGAYTDGPDAYLNVTTTPVLLPPAPPGNLKAVLIP